MIKVAINGFGRIGRSALKVAEEKFKDKLCVIAVNDLADAKTLAHLLKYDSNYGPWHGHDIKVEGNSIIVDDRYIKVFNEKDPESLPWAEIEVDIVIESTGKFTDKAGASKHLKAGSKKVIISAPSKGDDPAATYVLGVNEVGDEDVINNASCTTNCIAPMIAVLNEAFGVEKALMTTIHGYTQDQLLQDGPHKDLRRARAAAENIVPTTTGAAKAATEVIPELKDKFDGVALRVPVAVGSISDITAVLGKEVTVEEINQAFKKASQDSKYKGVIAVTEDPIVSSDIVKSESSVIVDLGLTQSLGNLVKVFGWYDNEWGYSCRLIEQALEIGNR